MLYLVISIFFLLLTSTVPPSKALLKSSIRPLPQQQQQKQHQQQQQQKHNRKFFTQSFHGRPKTISKVNLFEYISSDDGALLAGKLFFLAYIGVSTVAGVNELRKRAMKALRVKEGEEEEET